MDALKAELNKLSAERAALEADINQRTARLNGGPGQPGMHESLVDKEGFPRADIDVHAVRLDRNAVIRLTNDHKALSQQMEQLLHKLHALARDAGLTSLGGGNSSSGGAGGGNAAATTSSAAAAANGQQEQHEDKRPRLDAAAAATTTSQAAGESGGSVAAPLRPFAVVDEIADGSPAATAGIQLGDQLCKFGAAVAGAGGGELQQHENQPVQTVFLRAGKRVELELVPRRWDGRGLLGCHLRPL